MSNRTAEMPRISALVNTPILLLIMHGNVENVVFALTLDVVIDLHA
mgnify:CR=1 FL=1